MPIIIGIGMGQTFGNEIPVIGPVVTNHLLLETGDSLLLETGDFFLLE